jgi:hypothetical protein
MLEEGLVPGPEIIQSQFPIGRLEKTVLGTFSGDGIQKGLIIDGFPEESHGSQFRACSRTWASSLAEMTNTGIRIPCSAQSDTSSLFSTFC